MHFCEALCNEDESSDAVKSEVQSWIQVSLLAAAVTLVRVPRLGLAVVVLHLS